jgi:hypothetical protein
VSDKPTEMEGRSTYDGPGEKAQRPVPPIVDRIHQPNERDILSRCAKASGDFKRHDAPKRIAGEVIRTVRLPGFDERNCGRGYRLDGLTFDPLCLRNEFDRHDRPPRS